MRRLAPPEPRNEEARLPGRDRHRGTSTQVAAGAFPRLYRRHRAWPRRRRARAWQGGRLRHAAAARRQDFTPRRGPARAADQAQGPPGHGRLRCQRRAHACRNRVCGILRHHGRRPRQDRGTQGRLPVLRRPARRPGVRCPAAGHRPGIARQAADREADALGERYRGVRPAGALGRHAVRRRRRGLLAAGGSRRRRHARASLSFQPADQGLAGDL